MQLLVDFFPLLLFFAAYLWQGIFFATGRGDRRLDRPDRLDSLEAWARGHHPLAVARDHRRLRRRDALAAGQDVYHVEADGALRPVRGDPRGGQGGLRPRPHRLPHERREPAPDSLDTSHVGLGRVLPVHGSGKLVRRFPLLRADVGVVQSLGGIGLFVLFAILQGIWLARHASTEETA
jgi:hypothetical protein